MSRFNILILHQMGIPAQRRSAVFDFEYMLPTYASEHNYIVHDCDLELPDFIKDIKFHAIILGPTFLCNRYYPKRYAKILKIFNFIKYSDAYKIAMPQDDYDCSEVLDNWMTDWEVDVVFTVISKYWDILYPKYIHGGGKLKQGYTGYISSELVQKWANPKKLSERTIDVSYRAAKLGANFGEIGYIKWAIADRFLQAVSKYGLQTDISVSYKDMIPGNKWHEFIENSKCCLVTNSGSSLLDPVGKYRESVRVYSSKNPNATFYEIRDNCFPREDNKYHMTAISPRNIEAALACTTQIAVQGDYSGILKPDEHYIPLEVDCSNIDDVVSKIKNESFMLEIQRNTKDTLLSIDELRYSNHVASILDLISRGIVMKNIVGDNENVFNKYSKMYQAAVVDKYDALWGRKLFLINVKKSIKFMLFGRS